MAFGLDDAVAAGLKIIDKFVPDPQAKAQASKELRDSLQGWDKAQSDINLADAQSGSLYQGGWRPAIGWCCAGAVFYSYLFVPLTMYAGFVTGHPIPKPPVLDEHLWELLFILLGVGGLRTYEKLKGVA